MADLNTCNSQNISRVMRALCGSWFMLLALNFAPVIASSSTNASAQEGRVVPLSFGRVSFKAELAEHLDDRQRGLMFRKALAKDQGMLFVFDRLEHHCMWMRNTLIALDVAFIDEHGKIINIERMQPQTDNAHCAARPARYALEMEQGWFAQNKISNGRVMQGLPRYSASDGVRRP